MPALMQLFDSSESATFSAVLLPDTAFAFLGLPAGKHPADCLQGASVAGSVAAELYALSMWVGGMLISACAYLVKYAVAAK